MMVRILAFVVGVTAAVKPGILVWAAGVDYAMFLCTDLIGGCSWY